MATQQHRSRLATHRTNDTAVDERIAYRRRRVALCELFQDAPRKPDAIYDLQRTDPRCQLPDEKLRTMIHDGIRAGMISRERLIRYRAQQLMDDFAQFPGDATVAEVLYVRAMLEQAEAIEAQTVAHAMPTEANRLAAYHETKESVAMQELLCVVLRPDGGR